MKLNIQMFLFVFVCASFGMGSLAYGEISLSTGVRCDTFHDDRSPETDGFETTIPLGMTYEREHLFVTLETAYSHANVDYGADSDSSISSLTDTLLSVSYTFPDLPVGVIVGLDMNLPTGKARLTEDERRAEFGENNDFFEVDDFGEGFNAGLSLGLMKEFGDLSLGLSGAYIFKGEFDPTKDIPNDDLDPGDQALVVASLDWQASSRFVVSPFAAYSHFSVDKFDGDKVFQEGGRFAFGGNLYCDLKPVGFFVSLQNVIQSKNEELAVGTLKIEPENSNGNEFFGLVDVTYGYSPQLSLRLLGDLRYYGESDRKDEISGLPYTGKRIRYASGPGFTYVLNKQLLCNGLAKYFIMNQDRDILNQDTTFQGVNLDVGITYTF